MSDGRTIWGVTATDRGGNGGYYVECLFTTEEAARAYVVGDKYAGAAGAYEIEEFTLYEDVS